MRDFDSRAIAGFHDACVGIAGAADRLPGHQGVIIPRANVGDLMLRRDIVDSCRAGRFHVWAIDSIDEGLEILTGREAGTADARGRYPDGTIHHAVRARLHQLSLSHHGGFTREHSVTRVRREHSTQTPGRSATRVHERPDRR